MQFVWDLDGTLVETREANLHAYKSIGVCPPYNFHVRPWQEWCTREEHYAKGLVIRRFILNYAKPLLLDLYLANGGGQILTNASPEAIAAILEAFPVLTHAPILGGMNGTEKAQWLAMSGEPGVYFDDSIETIKKVKEWTRWKTVLVPLSSPAWASRNDSEQSASRTTRPSSQSEISLEPA